MMNNRKIFIFLFLIFFFVLTILIFRPYSFIKNNSLSNSQTKLTPVSPIKMVKRNRQPQQKNFKEQFIIAHSISTKVLTNQNDQEQLNKIFKEAYFLPELLQKLQNPHQLDFTKERLKQIDLVIKALGSTDIAISQKTEDLVQNFILYADYLPETPLSNKKNLAGDKLEFFSVLSRQNPERAQAIIDSSTGWTQKLLKNYQGYYVGSLRNF